MLTQRPRDVKHDVYGCFIDYQKAFDRMKHDKLLEILKGIGIENQDLRIISYLCWNLTLAIRVEGEMSENISIKQSLKQRCVFLLLLFDNCLEFIFRVMYKNMY